MTMTDPIADMLTRIRNGIQARHKEVAIPASKLKLEIARILKEEGYIKDFAFVKEMVQGQINVQLKYTQSNKGVITSIQKVSRPGLRVYVGKEEIPRVLNGLGTAILSTSKGVITDKKAKELGVGGEVLLAVY
jgi:small subunit ribosomal protein S8